MAKINDQYENLINANKGSQVSSVFMDVVEKYLEIKDVVVDIYKSHASKLKDNFADPHFFQYLQNFQNNVFQPFVNALTDMTDIGLPNGSHISNLFVISIFFLSVSSIGSFIGSYLVSFALANIFLEFGAFFIAMVVIPFMSCYYFFQLNLKSLSDDKRRITAALFVLEQGIMIGFFNRAHYLDSPFMVVSQITSSFAFPLALSQSDRKEQVLGAVAGCSLVAHFIHGAMFSILSPGFFILAIGYTALAVAFIQYTLAYRAKTDFDDIFISMHYTFLIAIIKMFGLMMFGMSADEYAARK